MVKHVLKDGRTVAEISGYTLKKGDFPAIYATLGKMYRREQNGRRNAVKQQRSVA